MVVCVECGVKVESLYKIFDCRTIQLRKCSNCGNVADKYQKWDSVLRFINIVLLKKPIFRHILNNYYDSHSLVQTKRKSKFHFYVMMLTLFTFWSTLDAYKLIIINNCFHFPQDPSTTEKFLSIINVNNVNDAKGSNAINSMGESDRIFDDTTQSLATNTADHLIYVFYKISHYMIKESGDNKFYCKSLESGDALSKIHKLLIRQNFDSLEGNEPLMATLISNALTVVITAFLATIVGGDFKMFKNNFLISLMSLHGKTFTLLMIIWHADIYVDLFIYIYVMWSYVITLHIYLDKPHIVCMGIVVVSRLAQSAITTKI